MTPARFFPVTMLAILAGLSSVAAQPHGAPRVTATGVGEFQISPDHAVISVEASNTDGSPIGAANDTRKDMAAILAAARKRVKGAYDVRTTRLSINPEYEWAEGKRKFRGYTASQSLEITMRDLSKLDSLLYDLAKSPLKTLGNLEFRHSKADSLRRIALALAVRDADANAKMLCAAAGRTCAEPVSIRMGGSGGPGPTPYMEMKAMRADAGSLPVQPGMITFAAMVEADYLFTPPPGSKPVPAPKVELAPEAPAGE